MATAEGKRRKETKAAPAATETLSMLDCFRDLASWYVSRYVNVSLESSLHPAHFGRGKKKGNALYASARHVSSLLTFKMPKERLIQCVKTSDTVSIGKMSSLFLLLCPWSSLHENRLVFGLASGQDGVRQGYATVLTELLSVFPFLTVHDIFNVVDSRIVSAQVEDEKQMFFGRIFAVIVVLRSGRLASLSTGIERATILQVSFCFCLGVTLRSHFACVCVCVLEMRFDSSNVA